jgi:EF-P beta-lysylation protein EpmB
MSIPPWRQIQKENFTDWKKLLIFLELDSIQAESLVLQRSKFPLNLPKRLAEKVKKGCWEDPVLRQFLPTLEEQKISPLFVLDPVGDGPARKALKLLYKYHGRALLVCTGACAMHCRYCFRQHFDYETGDKLFEEELAVISSEPSISEVLLSGGDPLSLSNVQLEHLLGKLSEIPHVKRVRFHTRFPMGIPERIDEELLSLFASCPKQIVFAIHCNHANEFDAEIFQALRKVQLLGIPLITQTVLLQGVNDSVEALKALFELLIDNGIIPNYLHQLDRVQGAAHFEVAEEKGLQLMDQLSILLPGYALPKYVREIPGEPRKVPITSDPRS